MIMYKVNTRCIQLHVNLHKMFHMSLESIHDTRNSRKVRKVFSRTTNKGNCITVHGITFCTRYRTELGDHKMSMPLRNGTVYNFRAGTHY